MKSGTVPPGVVFPLGQGQLDDIEPSRLPAAPAVQWLLLASVVVARQGRGEGCDLSVRPRSKAFRDDTLLERGGSGQACASSLRQGHDAAPARVFVVVEVMDQPKGDQRVDLPGNSGTVQRKCRGNIDGPGARGGGDKPEQRVLYERQWLAQVPGAGSGASGDLVQVTKDRLDLRVASVTVHVHHSSVCCIMQH